MALWNASLIYTSERFWNASLIYTSERRTFNCHVVLTSWLYRFWQWFIVAPGGVIIYSDSEKKLIQSMISITGKIAEYEHRNKSLQNNGNLDSFSPKSKRQFAQFNSSWLGVCWDNVWSRPPTLFLERNSWHRLFIGSGSIQSATSSIRQWSLVWKQREQLVEKVN